MMNAGYRRLNPVARYECRLRCGHRVYVYANYPPTHLQCREGCHR